MVGDVDLNLLKASREAETTSLASLVKGKDKLVPGMPCFTIPTSLHCDVYLTQAQRADVAAMQQRFADVVSILPGCTTHIEYNFDRRPGMTVCSRPYHLPKHKRQIVQME